MKIKFSEEMLVIANAIGILKEKENKHKKDQRKAEKTIKKLTSEVFLAKKKRVQIEVTRLALEQWLTSRKRIVSRQALFKKTIREELGLSSRTCNALEVANIRTVGDLIKKKPEELLKIKNIWLKAVVMIRRALKNSGLSLRGEK